MGTYCEHTYCKFGVYVLYLPPSEMVYNKSSQIGCGNYACKFGNIYVCLYAHSVIKDDKLKFPYSSGNSCYDCSCQCTDYKLCDFKGKTCAGNKELSEDGSKCKRQK